MRTGATHSLQMADSQFGMINALPAAIFPAVDKRLGLQHLLHRIAEVAHDSFCLVKQGARASHLMHLVQGRSTFSICEQRSVLLQAEARIPGGLHVNGLPSNHTGIGTASSAGVATEKMQLKDSTQCAT